MSLFSSAELQILALAPLPHTQVVADDCLAPCRLHASYSIVAGFKLVVDIGSKHRNCKL